MSSGLYLIDRLNESTWTIIDRANLDISIVAFIIPCHLKTANWQIIIAVTEGMVQADIFQDGFFLFSKELFSVTFYSRQTDLGSMMNVVLDSITNNDLDIYNLVELTTYLGGQVNHETIPCPPIVISAYH